MISFLASIAPLAKSEGDEIKIPYRLPIRGVAVDTSVNKNNWRVSEKLMQRIAEDLKRRNLRVNHGGSVTDVIGKITNATIEGEKIVFDGEIIGSDPITSAVKEKIINGLLDSVSIGMDGFKVICSVCGEPTRMHGKTLHHDPSEHEPPGHEVILDGEVKELSIVLDPAYEATKINIAASFVAAMDTYLTVTPRNEGVTGEVGDGQKGRPADIKAEKEEEKGDKMSAVVPSAEPSGTSKGPSYEDILRVLQETFGKSDSRIAELEARLKALEDAIAKTMKKEDEEKKEEMEEAVEEAVEAEEVMEAREKKLAKSATKMVASEGKPSWVAELEEAIKKAQRFE